VDKAPDAFRTISEVADDLKLPQHVLRFWESRFVQIKPMKRAGGRRYYRPDDVDLLRGIHHLLYGEGYTIRGVQRILRDQGSKFVQVVWQAGAAQPMHGPDIDGEVEDAIGGGDGDERGLLDRLRGRGDAIPALAAAPESSAKASSQADDFSRDDFRKLQAALFELTECRRLLDAAIGQDHF